MKKFNIDKLIKCLENLSEEGNNTVAFSIVKGDDVVILDIDAVITESGYWEINNQ